MALSCGSSIWKNGFYLFAAFFTALSLGYRMPAASLCYEAGNEFMGVERVSMRVSDAGP
jgi:hypothetical protein